jgi:hypothetical protein
MDAGIARDTVALARILAADATLVGSDGSVETGAQQHREIVSGTRGDAVFDTDSTEVPPRADGSHGERLQRVRGHCTPPGGQRRDVNEFVRFLDVWQRIGGRWQIVAEFDTSSASPSRAVEHRAASRAPQNAA